MQLPSILSILTLASAASAVTVSYDTGYDLPNRSLNDVACSDGANGLITRFGWKTQGQTSNFPNVGGVVAVGGWDSASCGTCWKLTYKGRSVNVLAIDHADAGYNIGLKAMNTLTNGKAKQLGRVEAKAVKVPAKQCGVPS